MSEPHDAFTLNHEEVTAKVIDGELIVIRLSDGTYYSMDNVGTRVWELIESAHDLGSIVDTLTAWYGAAREHVERDVAALARELVAERLIVAAPAAAAERPTHARPSDLGAYETPRLNVYRDMGNLLALDPPTPGIDDLLFKDGKGR